MHLRDNVEYLRQMDDEKELNRARAKTAQKRPRKRVVESDSSDDSVAQMAAGVPIKEVEEVSRLRRSLRRPWTRNPSARRTAMPGNDHHQCF